MMEANVKRFVGRQYNYNQVPNPLVEGLVFWAFGPASPEQVAVWNTRIEGQKAENRMVLGLEQN